MNKGFNVPTGLRLKIWQKLVLIAALMGAVIPFVIYQFSREKNYDIEFARKELRGVEYVRPVARMLQNLQKHRSYNGLFARGDKSVLDELSRQRQMVDENLAIIDALDQRFGVALVTSAPLNTVRTKWDELKRRSVSFTPKESFDAHTDLCAELKDLIVKAADSSNLILDPDLDSYYLMDSMINQIPRLTESLGQMHAVTVGVAASKTKTRDDENLLVLLSGRTTENLRNIRKGLETAFGSNPIIRAELTPLTSDSVGSVEAFLTVAENKIVRAGTIESGANELLTGATNAIDSFFKLHDALAVDLAGLLQRRIDGLAAERNFALAVTLAGVLLTLLAVAAVTSGIARQLNSLSGLVADLEAGNLEARAAVTAHDELGVLAATFNKSLDNIRDLMQSKDERDRIQRSIIKLLDEVSGVANGDLTREAAVTDDVTGAIADAFNYMIASLRQLISKVQDVTSQVTMAAGDTQTTAERLALGSQVQAAQITNTSTALTDMANTFQKVSESASISVTVADQSLTTARKGTQVVGSTMQNMTRIQEQVQETARRMRQLSDRTQEIEEIVVLIDEIADRTGVLALNASIQAAAAGDAGRGFAVVASEVEQLAGRSTDATKRISNLVRSIQNGTAEAINAMEETTREVVAGSKLAGQAGQSLTEIETVSHRLAELVRSISHACQQQARSSELLARAMNEIASITHQTTAGMIDSAVTIKSLASLGDELRDSISSFKLPGQNGHGRSRQAVGGRR